MHCLELSSGQKCIIRPLVHVVLVSLQETDQNHMDVPLVVWSKMYRLIKMKLPLVQLFWTVTFLRLVENEAHLKTRPFSRNNDAALSIANCTLCCLSWGSQT